MYYDYPPKSQRNSKPFEARVKEVPNLGKQIDSNALLNILLKDAKDSGWEKPKSRSRGVSKEQRERYSQIVRAHKEQATRRRGDITSRRKARADEIAQEAKQGYELVVETFCQLCGASPVVRSISELDVGDERGLVRMCDDAIACGKTVEQNRVYGIEVPNAIGRNT